MAIYQARFLKYLHARGIANTENRKVWVFCGDGEMDEVESLGAIGLAAREKLDNLIFVINCNLQRLDGPVRGNGKIIQELEGEFRGAGWNVIKLLWGSDWDPLLARDKDGALRKADDGHARRRLPVLQGQRRRLRAQALLRPRPAHAGNGRQDERRRHLGACAAAATTRRRSMPRITRRREPQGQPTVLLIKTIKGFGMGKAGEGKNNVHQTKKLTDEDIKSSATASTFPFPTASCRRFRSTSRPTTHRK
jgi:pyruvate dehydrogenase E1 component